MPDRTERLAENFEIWIRTARVAEILVILDITADELLLRSAGSGGARQVPLIFEAGISAKRAANLCRQVADRTVSSSSYTHHSRMPLAGDQTITITNLTDQPNRVELRFPFPAMETPVERWRRTKPDET